MNCSLIFVPVFFTLLRYFVAWKGHDEKNGFTVPDGLDGVSVLKGQNGGVH
ncbi:hypothetical protein [Xenorhabdus santafensis]|uniref:hypothetical protein n=1 Tax=Xenorhabdus santafensis TaxID=2582833 RepID=UPI0029E7EB74|nr:hypothetical protein [Xenorhabdus sp. 12]